MVGLHRQHTYEKDKRFLNVRSWNKVVVLVDTYNDFTTVIESGRSSRVDASHVLLPPANALCDVLLVAPDPLRVREVDSADQDASLRRSYAKQ